MSNLRAEGRQAIRFIQTHDQHRNPGDASASHGAASRRTSVSSAQGTSWASSRNMPPAW